jgi:hypothetical protein
MISQYNRISQRAKQLLATGEDKFVDYKEKVAGLHSEDLVAFANSDEGGVILIGVREATAPDGRQFGKPIGHRVDDTTRLQIMDKALSCSPPLQIQVVIENLGSKPFYRIEIPTSKQKPHATSNGTYKIREDGRNNSLYPEQLLKIFLQQEGEEFRKRFKEATHRLDEQMATALSSVETLEGVISTKIEDIGSTLGWAEQKASRGADTIEAVEGLVSLLVREGRKDTQRLRAIIRKVEAKDPIKQKAKEELRKIVEKKIKDSPELLKAFMTGKLLSVSIEGEVADEFDQEDLRRLVDETLKAAIHKGKDGT